MLQYLLQTIAFQLIFILTYEFLLKKETFFSYNRVYLLITPLVSLVLPLLELQFLQQAFPAEGFVMLPEVFLGDNAGAVSSTNPGASSSEVAADESWWLVLYASGFLLSLGFFLIKFKILRQLFSYKRVLKNEEMKVVEVPESRIACSFYNTIFLGEELGEKEREQILSHEIIHVRQKHTLDLLFFEALKIIFWFNPLIYIYQVRISAVHEYLADAGVVQKLNKQDYFQQLLNSAFNTEDISFINQFFNHSIIKKRIIMLQKSKSKTTAKMKYLILVPLMMGMLTYVSYSQEGSDVSANKAEVDFVEKPESAQQDSLLEVPFAVVEQAPIFPGCESRRSNEERKSCMSEMISDFVNRNFNTSLGKELGLKGLNRIYVQFKISATGEVTDVKSRAPHPSLGEEAERVVNLLPGMKPGTQKGVKVAVLYSLPISFRVAEEKTIKEEKE